MKSKLLSFFSFLLLTICANSQNGYTISTIAGTGIPGMLGDGSLATLARLNFPSGVAVDGAGNIYITAQSSNKIRKIDTFGIITTYAGTGTPGDAGDGALATAADINSPTGIAADLSGNIYFTNGGYTIRKISTLGIITTIAGTPGSAGFFGDGGLATSAKLSNAVGITFDIFGNLLIADSGNRRIRKVNTSGIISTIAGNGISGYTGDGGPAISATTIAPIWIANDASNNIYFSDAGNYAIRKINVSGTISTIAGTNTNGYSGDGGLATLALINGGGGISIDNLNNLYFSDVANNVIRKINATGIISTIAGNLTSGYSGDGGPSINANLNSPFGLTLNSTNDILFCDQLNNVVRKVNPCSTPLITVTGNTSLCNGTSTTLNASGPALTFSWNGGISNGVSFTPSATTVYTVTAIDATCYNTMDVTVNVSLLTPQAPDICMVTVDSISQNNVIYWDKTSYVKLDSFIIFREVSTGIYNKIGEVSFDSLSLYVDTARTIGPANGNPNIGSYRYKLGYKDTCGHYSALSPYHNTVYFIDNHTGTFTWNLYNVESTTTPVLNFNLLRDDFSTGVWNLIGSVSGTQITINDPSYATYQTTGNWRVEATGFNCTPTRSAQIKSYSNTTKNAINGISDNAISNIQLYPNPSQNEIIIDNINEKSKIQFIDISGKTVKDLTVNGKTKMDISDLAKGFYLVKVSDIKNLKAAKTFKLVKE